MCTGLMNVRTRRLPTVFTGSRLLRGIQMCIRDSMEAAKGEKLSFSSRFHMAFDSAFHRLVLKYKSGVFFMLKRKWLAGALLLVACAGLFLLMKTTKTGLVPQEDMGTIFVDVRTSRCV